MSTLWRRTPPDRPGWWWKRIVAPEGGICGPWVQEVVDVKDEGFHLGEGYGKYEWLGPIPEPTDEPPTPAALRFHVETRLRDALLDDASMDAALVSIKVGVDLGRSPRENVRVAIAGFCLAALGIAIDDL